MNLTTSVFAKSALNNPIFYYHFAKPGPRTLILGGVHGDEVEGVVAAQKLLEHFLSDFSFNLDLTIIPQFNIDGILARERTNGNGVDLNRNLPTKDWSPEIKTPRYHPGPNANSESENQALSRFIEEIKPQFVLSLHSWKPMLNVNGDCQREAQVIADLTGYRIDPDIGYPTPGSLGTFAGIERNCPTLTYEIERGLDFHSIIQIHVPAILKALKQTETRTS
jgi:protein MpaA